MISDEELIRRMRDANSDHLFFMSDEEVFENYKDSSLWATTKLHNAIKCFFVDLWVGLTWWVK